MLIFTNGCFDVIHRGHLELLQYCSTLGSKVIVGLNSDNSARKLKGENRPVNNEQDRKFLLENLCWVDEVIIFDADTPYDLIQLLKPDIIVKGGDYIANLVIGSDLAEVRIFKYVDGYSSTKSIKNISDR